jgi:ribosomal-protein-alanine acetyltransferase
MEFRIVDVSAEHIRQIEEIERDCFSRPWTAEQLKSQMRDAQHEFIAAVSDGRVLGYVGLMYVLDEGYISNVAVHPDARRQGIGDTLIDALAAKAAELELAFLTLEVRESNAPAIALYAKHGFHPVGKRKNYYDAPKEDAVLMTCYLK